MRIVDMRKIGYTLRRLLASAGALAASEYVPALLTLELHAGRRVSAR